MYFLQVPVLQVPYKSIITVPVDNVKVFFTGTVNILWRLLITTLKEKSRVSVPAGVAFLFSFVNTPFSDNCYPGTTVLINKLVVRDGETLNKAEILATYINASKLEEHPLEGAFDFA